MDTKIFYGMYRPHNGEKRERKTGKGKVRPHITIRIHTKGHSQGQQFADSAKLDAEKANF